MPTKNGPKPPTKTQSKPTSGSTIDARVSGRQNDKALQSMKKFHNPLSLMPKHISLFELPKPQRSKPRVEGPKIEQC